MKELLQKAKEEHKELVNQAGLNDTCWEDSEESSILKLFSRIDFDLKTAGFVLENHDTFENLKKARNKDSLIKLKYIRYIFEISCVLVYIIYFINIQNLYSWIDVFMKENVVQEHFFANLTTAILILVFGICVITTIFRRLGRKFCLYSKKEIAKEIDKTIENSNQDLLIELKKHNVNLEVLLNGESVVDGYVVTLNEVAIYEKQNGSVKPFPYVSWEILAWAYFQINEVNRLLTQKRKQEIQKDKKNINEMKEQLEKIIFRDDEE